MADSGMSAFNRQTCVSRHIQPFSGRFHTVICLAWANSARMRMIKFNEIIRTNAEGVEEHQSTSPFRTGLKRVWYPLKQAEVGIIPALKQRVVIVPI